MICTEFYVIFQLDLRTCRHISWLYYALVCEVWNSNKCQPKTLESIQLCACKYILGCSITTGYEYICEDLGLETSKSRRDFYKLKCTVKLCV